MRSCSEGDYCKQLDTKRDALSVYCAFCDCVWNRKSFLNGLLSYKVAPTVLKIVLDTSNIYQNHVVLFTMTVYQWIKIQWFPMSLVFFTVRIENRQLEVGAPWCKNLIWSIQCVYRIYRGYFELSASAHRLDPTHGLGMTPEYKGTRFLSLASTNCRQKNQRKSWGVSR